MKSSALLTLLMLIVCALGQLLLPWWCIVPICFLLAAWRGASGGLAFLAGLLGAGLSWWIPAVWLNMHGVERLAQRLATLLPLGGNAALLVLLSGLIAGLVGGLAALSGAWFRQVRAPKATPVGTR
ncbi:hypothetical protein HMJ29_08715 [Hymenobacter taeanensis]|uniref:Uncharacterized protein n=1 Tax=Hymenobacter taeanensis TaxID=2735321 RepID=A0A6M6BG66_9BACT|nr:MULTISPECIES: hypothetical protein [Hymenobacter]QJX47010.1 hypothetical protein HMJ29_08715 [Hymenobacter taeanensis]UOQ80889.1 hypothetical protein MUN83_19080 [Hymenobacter sp. 5414T-23]